MCCRPWPPKAKYRNGRHRDYRPIIRALLAGIATLESDVFRVPDALRAYDRLGEPRYDRPYFSGAFGWLRQHGFIAVLGETKRGPWTRYYLTAQAVRWLDWTRFPW